MKSFCLNIRTGGAVLAAGMVLSTLTVHGAASPEPKPTGPKDATSFTRKANAAMAKSLPMNDRRDFESAKRGFVGPLKNNGTLYDASGKITYRPDVYTFPENEAAPDTVNPSLWRQAQLNSFSGLFKVADRIYQVRGQDVSNVSFIEGDTGIIAVDPLVTAEAARNALETYYQYRPRKPVVAVIHSHSHTDHYGGVEGLISREDAASGKVKVIAPAGFLEEAVSENVVAGNAMMCRGLYSYGIFLPKDVRGDIGCGLGRCFSTGSVGLIAPNVTITRTGEKLTVDGVEFEFLMAPGSEAPSEMHFYIPAWKALFSAENCCHTLHNVYTLRGATTRDVAKWVGYLNETLDRWGDQAEVLYMPHTWPVWGNADIVKHIEKYSDAFRYIHDQALHLANQGYTMNEIGNMLDSLPASLAGNWATRGYYGSVSHDARAVYNFYLGYFDGNPANLNPYSPTDMAERYVETFGAEPMIKAARKAVAEGDYRWAAELLKHVVFADPTNREARQLQADAFEQLGYQAECATWRGFYLSGAKELREGNVRKNTVDVSSPDTIAAMPVEMVLDLLAVRVDAGKAAGKEIGIVFRFPDKDDTLAVTLRNSVLNYRKKMSGKPDAVIAISRKELHDVLTGEAKLAALVKSGAVKVDGDAGKLKEMLSVCVIPSRWFNIITPNPPPSVPQTR